MPVLIRIAFRNMWEHKAKSLIIGSLVALGVIVIVLGNAMMDSASDGLRQGYIDSFTGDIMISAKGEAPISIFGMESMSMDQDNMEIPRIPEYETVMAKVKGDRRVKSATGMATAFGIITAADDEDALGSMEDDPSSAAFAILFGVDPASYFETFPSMTIVEGELLKPGESSLMVTTGVMEKLKKKYGDEMVPGAPLLVTGFGGAGMRIRETSLAGSYNRGEIGGDSPFVTADIDTVRSLAGLTLAADSAIEIADEHSSLLGGDDLDDLFGEDLLFDSSSDVASLSAASGDALSVSDFLGDTSSREILNTADEGAWHFILVRLENSASAPAVIADWQAWANEEGLEIAVNDWKAAAGTAGKMADIVRAIFNGAVIIIAIVAIIIMMNTLVISVIERTAEIGTMRALGASRSFVRTMFLTETLTITVFFGLLGSLLVTIALLVVNALNIPLENSFAQLLLGGEAVNLVPKLGSYIGTLVAVFAVGWLAHLYPVSVALKIQPVKAMQAE